MALGLHVRSEAKDLSDMDKEIRVRLFWSLYNLERLLDELTGRPSCISDRDLSTPLPINVDESRFRRDRELYEKPAVMSSSPVAKVKAKVFSPQLPTPAASSIASKVSSTISTSPIGSPSYSAFKFPMACLPITSSTYFIYRTQLSIISHEILTELYCAALVKDKWSDVQDKIRSIDVRLIKWCETLPKEFSISLFDPQSNPNDGYALYRTGLSMFYNSSRMTLFRPCLCRFEGRIENESNRSKTFDADAAGTCVESAQNVLAALPPISDPSKVYYIRAWWNVVHYIIEAASVLMLELAYRAEHLPSKAEVILSDAKKAVMWLRAMADQSIAARKWWEIFDSLLDKVAPKVGGETWSMPKSAPVPPGWKWSRFGRASLPSQDEADQADEMIIEEDEQEQIQSTYGPESTAIPSWVDQSSYDLQQGFSAPGPESMTAYTNTTESGPPAYLASLYPFNEIYGRYDEFGPWQTQGQTQISSPTQNPSHNPAGNPNSLYGGYGVGNYPSTTGPAALGLSGHALQHMGQTYGAMAGHGHFDPTQAGFADTKEGGYDDLYGFADWTSGPAAGRSGHGGGYG
jgi:Fungal specific transcription factor domain